MKNKIPTISITAICLLALIVLSSGIQSEKGGKMQQKYYYCEYCGHRFPSVRLLTSAPVSAIPTVRTKVVTNCMKARRRANTPANIAVGSSRR